MLNITSLLTGLIALLLSASGHAELNIKMQPFKGSESQALKLSLDAFALTYVDENSLVSKDYPYPIARNSKIGLTLFDYYDAKYGPNKKAETLYALNFNGQDYLAAVIAFNPLLTAENHCKPNDSFIPTGHCEKVARQQLTCHLFLFEPKTVQLQSVTPLHIVRDPSPRPGKKERSFQNYDSSFPNDPRQIEGWPRCISLLAVAPAKMVPDSILFTLGYNDSAAPINKFDELPLFNTSILLSLQTDAQGKLQVIQNEYCLGNPNTYSSIAAARKALAACEVQK